MVTLGKEKKEKNRKRKGICSWKKGAEMSRRGNAEVPEEQNQGDVMCSAVEAGSGAPEIRGTQGEEGPASEGHETQEIGISSATVTN